MKFSLLYGSAAPDTRASSAADDLSLDRIMRVPCPDEHKRALFTRVLSTPLTDTGDIEYRRGILADLTADSSLLPALKTVFNRYDRMKSDWMELRGSAMPSPSSASAALDAAWSSLKVTALFPNTLLSFFTNIRDTLASPDISSAGLCAVRDYCAEVIANGSLADIAAAAESFRYNTPDDYTFETAVTLGRGLEVAGAAVTAVFPRKKAENALLRAFRTKKEKAAVCTDGNAGEDANNILARALGEIDRELARITNALYETFYGISLELLFYEGALDYAAWLGRENIPCCMPVLLPAADMRADIHGLRDLYLASDGHGVCEIMPNDFTLTPESAGMLIRGENGSGKTTYLRSLGVAVLLAQGGLPIPAENAIMSVHGGVYTHFSSAEEKFTHGGQAGRFEGEARDMAQLMSSLAPYSLVLLNETFQTTSFSEGTAAMADILEALPRLSAQYVFVTHLTGLFDIEGSRALLCEADPESHAIKPITKQ